MVLERELGCNTDGLSMEMMLREDLVEDAFFSTRLPPEVREGGGSG